MEQLDYTLLFRWFVGRNPDDPSWVPSVFSKNRERLIDGTLLDAWASQKRVQPKDPAARPPSDDGDPKNPTITFRWWTSWMSGGIRSCTRPRMPSCGASNGRGCTRRDLVGGAAHARRIRARLTPSARGGAGECSQPEPTADRGVCPAYEQPGMGDRPRKYAAIGKGDRSAEGFGRECLPVVCH